MNHEEVTTLEDLRAILDATREDPTRIAQRALGPSAAHGFTEIVDYILKEFPDVDPEENMTLDTGAVTPFFAAAMGGHVDCMALLALSGASVTKHCGTRHVTPLHIASERGRTEAVRWLLDNGAGGCINQRTNDKSGATPLINACWNLHVETIRSLCESGANVNVSSVRPLAVQLEYFHNDHPP